MPRLTKIRLVLLFTALVIGMLVTFVPRSQAHALTYPKPAWWNGYQCDSGNNPGSYVLNSGAAVWNGIVACGPEPGTGTGTLVHFFSGAWGEYEWNCTELVTRYLYIVYGAVPISATGDQVVANYASTYSSLFTSITNDGNTHVFPKVGDVLSYSTVHTAIVSGITVTDPTNGNATLTVFEQNASSTGFSNQTVTGWKIKYGVDNGGTTDTVTAWLTPKQSWSDISPSGTTTDDIYSVASGSTTNVWAAGYEQPSGVDKQPVTYHNGGSGWTKYSPPSLGLYNNHWLYGIASSSSGDAWTVGEVDLPTSQTLAYHWNSSTQTWTHVTSDNSSSSYPNYLKGVAIDSSGNVWAVGYYQTASGNLPLVEKWNGTKLAQQTITLPSGTTSAYFNSVAFSSSSNGWAVGAAYNGTQYEYLAYHYDGSSWSSYTLGSSASSLTSVSIVSDSEAWAVGSQGSSATPLILHYTTSGWNEDTSFSSYYPASGSNTRLLSVGTDGASDVWIAGWWYNGTNIVPYTMHYNGYYWVQVNTPSVSGAALLQGVAVNSGDAWAGGQFGTSGTSTPTPLVYQYS